MFRACINKYPNHVTKHYVKSCVPFHTQWVTAYDFWASRLEIDMFGVHISKISFYIYLHTIYIKRI